MIMADFPTKKQIIKAMELAVKKPFWSVDDVFDAVLDVLPDSDRYGGATGIRSHEAELTFGLGKNTFLGLDVYRSWKLSDPKAPDTLVQVDWNMKF